jgi:hypothetical protein
MRKILLASTLFIENGNRLEEVKDLFQKKNLTTLWGYDASYDLDSEASSGFLHFDGLFYMSKLSFDKPVITFDELKNNL